MNAPTAMIAMETQRAATTTEHTTVHVIMASLETEKIAQI
jgi:hypothetical protein